MSTPPPAPKPKAKRRRRSDQDPWQLWFFRLVQGIGLVLIVWEIFYREHPRMIVVGTCLAMMSGALGVERLAQWYMRR